jgi:hypothetical protein
MFWHEDCLKCGCCDCRLGEVGSTLYTKANLILCKRDYLRLVPGHITCRILCLISLFSRFWDVTHRRLVRSYRRFGTTYLPIIQGSVNPRSLENGADRLYRNVGDYQSTVRNILEDRRSRVLLDKRKAPRSSLF